MAAPSTCEGIRMTKLREVLDKTLEEFFKSAQSPELIARCFPQLSQEYGEHIADLFAQATSFIRDNTLTEFDAIAAEVELGNALNRLDRACSEGIPVPPAPWTHSLKRDIMSEVVRTKRAEEEKLRTLLAQMSADNNALEAEVAALDTRAQSLCAVASKISGAISASK